MHRLGGFLLGPWLLICYLAAVSVVALVLAFHIDPIDSSRTKSVDSVPASRAIMITADLATGGNPREFEAELRAESSLWVASWVIHVVGWVLVPAVIGYLVSHLIVHFKLAHDRGRRQAVLDELADAEQLEGEKRAEFKRKGLELLEANEQFIFGRRR